METDEHFSWSDYLESTNRKEVPPDLFPHVEEAIISDIVIGMSLEVPTGKTNDETVYWVATVSMVCGPLLRLRYFGGDKSQEFWFDTRQKSGHELGWCKKHNRKLQAPQPVINRSPNCVQMLDVFLASAKSIKRETLVADGFCLMDKIKPGLKVEISDLQNPYTIWFATVIRNVGGRLLLQYNVPKSGPILQIWLFCTSPRLHPYGFAKKHPLIYNVLPPDDIKMENNISEWIQIQRQYSSKNITPSAFFQIKNVTKKHFFKTGMKLEALCPVTRITVPQNYYLTSKRFIWDTYLRFTISEAVDKSLFPDRKSAPAEYKVNSMLETVDPENPNNICAARITKIIDDLLFLKLDNCDNSRPDIIRHIHSSQLFPVGWCASNNYPLLPPKDHSQDIKMFSLIPIRNNKTATLGRQISKTPVSQLCPKIYINYQCYRGPLLSKRKLSCLPKSIGPGPLVLMQLQILSMLRSTAHRTLKVLNKLRCNSELKPGYKAEILETKSGKRVHKTKVAVVTSENMIAEFCMNVCTSLSTCPNLIGPELVEKCSKTCHKGRRESKEI